MPRSLNTANSPTDPLNGIDLWIFDLDNTLYPQDIDLFAQMRRKTHTYIRNLLGVDEAAASELYDHYEDTYGTAFRGLMMDHGIEPGEFLDYVHDIGHDLVMPDPVLANAIRALPGKRVIYTNGTVDHVNKVLRRLDLVDAFDEIFDIVWADLDPKPHRAPYLRLLDTMQADPARSAMFEDCAKNLVVPFELGISTILVSSDPGSIGPAGTDAKAGLDHVDFVTGDLGSFLEGIVSPDRNVGDAA